MIFYVKMSNGCFNGGRGNPASNFASAVRYPSRESAEKAVARFNLTGAVVLTKEEAQHWQKLGKNRTSDE